MSPILQNDKVLSFVRRYAKEFSTISDLDFQDYIQDSIDFNTSFIAKQLIDISSITQYD